MFSSCAIQAFVCRRWQLTCITTTCRYHYINTSLPSIPFNWSSINRTIQFNYSSVRSLHTEIHDVNGDDETNKKKPTRIQSHIYNNIYPWSNKAELADHLLQSKIYEDKDLLVLNKPFGVGQSTVTSKTTLRCYGRSPPSKAVTVADVMKLLQESTGHEELQLALAPEKWNSGVLVLAKTNFAAKAVAKSMIWARERSSCSRCYWSVTRDPPLPTTHEQRLYATKQDANSRVGPTLILQPSSSRISHFKQQPFKVKHDTISTSEHCSAALVELHISSTKHNCVRVWLSHCLAVPLGDHLFGGRVSYLMGVPVPVPDNRSFARQTPHTFEFLHKLELVPSLTDLIPLLLHLRSVTLPDFFKITNKTNLKKKKSLKDSNAEIEKDESKNSHKENDSTTEFNSTAEFDSSSLKLRAGNDLILTAPVPDHFQWTMDQLGLRVGHLQPDHETATKTIREAAKAAASTASSSGHSW